MLFRSYGDEIGMRYVEGLSSVEGGYNRTGSRSPMQWDNTANAGFSSAPAEKLYIKMDDAPDRPTVEAQLTAENSLYHEVKKLIAIRQAHPALQSRGEIEFVHAEENAYPLAYLRSADSERILIIVNPASRAESFESVLPEGELLYSCGAPAKKEGSAWMVPPCSVSFIKL